MAYNFQKYQRGDQVVQAQQQLDQQQAMRPADYQSQWADRIGQKADEILNRKPFEYDVNADALYQQYVDNYVRNGRLAMMDTVGQASQLTGGYGNSYANMAGQQVYQQYLAGLTDKIPELQRAALDRYNAEGDRMVQEYGLMADRENQDYSRYQDQYSQWMNWTNYLANRLDNAQQQDYSMFANEREAEMADWQYQQKLAQQQVEYLLSVGADVPEELAQLSGYDAAYLEAKKKPANTWYPAPADTPDHAPTPNAPVSVPQVLDKMFAEAPKNKWTTAEVKQNTIKALVDTGKMNEKQATTLVNGAMNQKKALGALGLPL